MDKNNLHGLPVAVILGGGVNALGVSRSLGTKGISVYVFLKDDGKDICRYSKYVSPVYYKTPEDLLDKLNNLKKSDKKVLFCTADHYIKFICTHRKDLCAHYIYYWDQIKLHYLLTDKSQYAKLIKNDDIELPVTLYPSEMDKIDLIDKIDPPMIIKPISEFSHKKYKGLKNIILNSKSHAKLVLTDPTLPSADYVIQKVIEHSDEDVFYCTGLLGKTGINLASFSAQKIRQYPPGYGVTSFAVSKDLPIIKRLAETVLKKIDYKGLFDIEFIYDQTDKKYKLIEINPRTHLANSHSLSCGINLPYIAYCDLCGFEIPKLVPPQKNKVWVYFNIDMGSFWKKFYKKEITFQKWTKSIIKANSFSIFSIDDIKPFLYSLSDLLTVFVSKINHYFR